MPTNMLESINFPGFFIRHHNFEGELNEYEPAKGQDYQFEIVSRGDGGMVSLKSVNFPNRLLRHKDFRLLLEEAPKDGPERQLFDKDSTFFLEVGLADINGFSFRSTNFPDHYIRHFNFHLFIGKKDSENLNADATFLKQPPR